MKKILIFLFGSLSLIKSFGQISNVKAGVWSDPTVWGNNSLPTSNDDVILHFDITIDINASCQSLTLNGNNVTVNAGVQFNISGNSNGFILSKYVVFDTIAAATLDTVHTIQFYYDSAKRNTGIEEIHYWNGIKSMYQYKTTLFYNGNDTLPFRGNVTSPFIPKTDDDYFAKTSYYFYSNGVLVADSNLVKYGMDSSTQVNKYVYNNSGVLTTGIEYYQNNIYTRTDTCYIQRTNGNITSQIDAFQYHSDDYPAPRTEFIYDNRPNPFKRTQYKIAADRPYPFYTSETFIEEIFENNNVLEVNEFATFGSKYNLKAVYEYKQNGYPKTVWFYDPNDLTTYGKGIYFYTN